MQSLNNSNEEKSPLKSSNTKLVVAVDDEPDILELLDLQLTKAGFKVKTFENADDMLQFIKVTIPDIFILDLMLPDADGFEICKFLKKEDRFTNIPVIMLTARSDEMDTILGLELGADDYVTKPFSPRELVARIKAVLRREDKTSKSQKIKIGDSLVIDLQKYDVFVNDKKIDLTSTEFRILKLLAERKGWVYARDQILDYLGVQDKGVLDRTVDVHIKNLREKLNDAGKYIKNIRGVGYKLIE